MGVKGLLPLLQPISSTRNLDSLRGQTVAVDTYCWLHKAALSCSEDIALSRDTDLYLNYCLKYINMLLSYDLKIILVFDGKSLPAKKDVEIKRRENREINMNKALQLMVDNNRAEAKMFFDRCVNISHHMASKLIKTANHMGLKCIVAPYEADAQLAYLGRNNLVDYVITDDSDLLLFGTPKVLFKLDLFGNAVLIEKKDLNKVLGFSLERYSFDKFRYICIIAGCDYYSGVNRVGLLTAIKLVKQTQLSQLSDFLKRINMYSKSKIIISKEEIQQAVVAEQTLLHQIVFDPVKKKQVPLTEYPVGSNSEDFVFAGQVIEDELLTFELACGKRNPKTGEIIPNYNWVDKLMKQDFPFHYHNIPESVDKSIEKRKSVSLMMNRSKSLSVQCDFPWTNASKSFDSDSQVNMKEMFECYTSENENYTSTVETTAEDEADEVSDILKNILDHGESIVHVDVNTSSPPLNPFSKQPLIRKRFIFKSPGKENREYVAGVGDIESVKRKCLQSSPLIKSNKIIAQTTLTHLFKK